MLYPRCETIAKTQQGPDLPAAEESIWREQSLQRATGRYEDASSSYKCHLTASLFSNNHAALPCPNWLDTPDPGN